MKHMSKTAKDYQIIDSDTHITEPADVWTSRVAAKYKDKVPHVRVGTDGKTQTWFLDDTVLAGVGSSAFAGWPEPFPSFPPTYAEAHKASYDATARLKYMDDIDCWAAVLYPNIGGFGSQAFLQIGDPALMYECVRAYNDFQLDWISPNPKRFIPIAAMPFWDVPIMVKEVERCARRGFKGVLFTAAPQDYGLPLMSDPHWNPFFAACQDADISISFHIGTGDFMDETKDAFTPKRLAAEGWQTTYGRSSVNLFFGNAVQLCDLLFSGVLVRFPKLKFVSVESGIGWIPFLLDAADYHFNAVRLNKSRPEFTMLPSDYFRRQVYGCYWFENGITDEIKNKVGLDKIMFETDFPHVTCLYENVQTRIDEALGDENPDARRRVLFDNAAALYNVDIG